MKLFLLSILFFACFASTAIGQNPGDTIIVNTFNYSQTVGSGNRDTIISFPNLPGITYEKIIMKYNMRCKNGLVSPPVSGQTNIGCGEWDYSCNTYVHDSSRVDSLLSKTNSHLIPSFTGTTFNYTNQPTYSIYPFLQQNVVLNSIISETQSPVGTGSTPNPDVVANTKFGGKSQYLFTASELISAGVTAGDIKGFLLNILGSGTPTDFLRVKMKSTTATVLSGASPDMNGWTNVYFQNTTFVTGSNRIQFYQPFTWDGTSNVIIEISFNNGQTGNNLSISSHSTSNISGLTSSGDHFPLFDGTNYLEADTYTGVLGTAARTIEAWIRTTVGDKEIVSWGSDVSGQKWVFRLDNTGKLRLEVNGGANVGTSDLRDGNWHHVTMRFQGNNVNAVQFFVDGIQETISASTAITLNTGSAYKVRISRGVNNRYWDGEIDEVRIWNAFLSPTTIADWKTRKVTAAHPDFANLKAYYPLNQTSGSAVNDASANGNNMTTYTNFNWDYNRGEKLFKDFVETTLRPNMIFVQGSYNLTITPTNVNDTVLNTPYPVTTYSINAQSGTVNSDNIVASSPLNLWEATYNYLYDYSGVLVDSFPVTAQGTINITQLDYYQRWPMKFEIMSFVTPYGINLDLGPTGKTWTFDMTDYTPILKGSKRMTMERGGQRQEDMDIQFLFIVGTPQRNVLDIREIWRTESRGYTSIMSDQYFEPINVPLLANGNKFKVRTSITGHGQEGEFIPRTHFLNVNGGAPEFSWLVLKECAENPVYPQGGTWIYDRTGWCPGMATDVQESDITSFVTAGTNVNLDYGVTTASGTSNYIVSNQLVTYGPANHVLDATITEIKQPTDQVEYARFNSICNEPIVKLKNTGATTITSAKIKYWVNDVNNAMTFTWTGSMAENVSVDVTLPSPHQLWTSLSPTQNQFHAEVIEVNGASDNYALNNHHQTNFTIPEVMPSNIVVHFKTNLAGSESSYDIRDEQNQIIFSRSGMLSNTLYRDTVMLPLGCFSYNVYDSDDDGIKFFANNDGTGYTRFYELGGPIVKNFEADFGNGFRFNFTSNFPLSYEEMNGIERLKVYPNPTNEVLNISMRQTGSDVELILYDQLGKVVRRENHKSENGIYEEKWNINELPNGVYILSISDGVRFDKIKVIKQ